MASPSSQRAWIEIREARVERQRLHVALLAEGVDRNTLPEEVHEAMDVALLAEGVDRNLTGGTAYALLETSPSSQRAWIEISSG